LLPFLFLVVVVAGGLYVRSAMREQASPQPEMTDDHIKTEWRKLGFFCELDAEKRVWVLTGSRAGLLYFPDLLLGYVADPKNAANGALEHYGPYGSLEVMTWMEPGLDGNAIRGSLVDLERLASLVETQLATAQPGERLKIREDYAANSLYGLVLDVRADGFDPAAVDREHLGQTIKPQAPANPKESDKLKALDKPKST
jgi:hypothetical protein